MATSVIPKHVIDMKIVGSTGGSTFTVAGGANIRAGNYSGTLTIPDGYVDLMHWWETNGDASVISVAFRNAWVRNTKSTTSSSLSCVEYALCVKYG